MQLCKIAQEENTFLGSRDIIAKKDDIYNSPDIMKYFKKGISDLIETEIDKKNQEWKISSISKNKWKNPFNFETSKEF